MKKIKKALRRAWLGVRIYRVRYLQWWHKHDRKYTWRWRAANGVVALLLLATIVMPVVQSVWERNRYELSAEASQLVGTTDQSLAKQLTYDAQNERYQFNKDAVATGGDAGLPTEVQKASVGATDKSNTKSYSLDVPEDFSKGVTYHDTNSQLSFSLVPQFDAMQGKVVNGHIVFPINGDAQAVYTLKNNGLKEDIVLPKATQDTMRFSYDLQLPKTLTAKALPDGSGGIGIYSADPSLFGSISYGSDKDRAAVEKARETADKTYLVFGLPAPVITAGEQGSTGKATARFELNNNVLTVVAERLDTTKGTISIDPSVVVTATSDFQTGGNNEGMIDFGTSGQITRGGLTGGTMGSWATTGNNYTSSNGGVATTVYNGYLYTTGYSGGDNTVLYAAINSNGTVDNWNSTTVMGTARGFHRIEAYNGYLYAMGGAFGATYYNTVEYAPIASNGTVGTWQSASSFTTARISFASAVYNGYLYIMGGYDGSNPKNDVQYAAIKADGSLGSWASTTSFTTTRTNLGGFAYNGYLYIMGGYNGASTYYSDVQYAKIANDGTVGSWTATTSFTTGRAAPEVTVYNGYAYIMGGTSNTTSALTDTQYAQINANGTIGSWRTSSTLNTGVWAAGVAAYNGYLYIVAGRNTSGVAIATTQYTQIDRAGKPVAFGTLTNNFTTARANICSVAYNGYLYAIGGSTTDSPNNNVTTVQYTSLNSSTGNNGSWSSTTALPASLSNAGCMAYNGYLYVMGGYTGTGTGSGSNGVYYVSISSNGTLGASWTSSANTSNLQRPGVFVYGTSNGAYIYALDNAVGGYTNYASLDASTGAVGTWSTSGNVRVNTYGNRGYAQVGKYLYAFGGHNSGTAYATAEYTSINNDGSINAWTSTTSMNTAIGYTNSTTVNGCIYSVGGETGGGTSMNNVQYACPNANGTISAWYNAPNLTVATTDMGVTSYNGYIYGVGGYTTSVQTTTQYAYVNNGGSGANNAWAYATNGLASGRTYSASAAYNGYLYVVSGVNPSNADTSDVQYSQIGTTGNTGIFSIDGYTLATARESASAVAYNGYLYVLGGKSNPSTFLGDTQYAPIGSSGALSGTFASTTSFPTGTGSDTGRLGTCSVAYKGYMYVTGGRDSSSYHTDTRYAAINPNGTLGTWADSGNNFTTARFYHSCFVANGYLYVLGGGTGSANLNDVQYAQINSNGTLGAWKYTSSFNGVRETAIAGYSNGFAYIYGGCSNTACNSYLGDTQFAPVNANGTLGAWQRSTSSIDGITGVAGEGAGIAYNGYLYTLGGHGINSADVTYTSLNSIPRTARYSKLIDLGTPTNISSITYSGTLPTSSSTPGIAPISFRAAGNDGVFGSVTSSSAITPGATGCLASNQNYKRYLLVTITLDDTNSAILADAAGTLSNVTDFTVNYTPVHPPPNIRLRHGQTLQQGNLSPLDTCTP